MRIAPICEKAARRGSQHLVVLQQTMPFHELQNGRRVRRFIDAVHLTALSRSAKLGFRQIPHTDNRSRPAFQITDDLGNSGALRLGRALTGTHDRGDAADVTGTQDESRFEVAGVTMTDGKRLCARRGTADRRRQSDRNSQ